MKLRTIKPAPHSAPPSTRFADDRRVAGWRWRGARRNCRGRLPSVLRGCRSTLQRRRNAEQMPVPTQTAAMHISTRSRSEISHQVLRLRCRRRTRARSSPTASSNRQSPRLLSMSSCGQLPPRGAVHSGPRFPRPISSATTAGGVAQAISTEITAPITVMSIAAPGRGGCARPVSISPPAGARFVRPPIAARCDRSALAASGRRSQPAEGPSTRQSRASVRRLE